MRHQVAMWYHFDPFNLNLSLMSLCYISHHWASSIKSTFSQDGIHAQLTVFKAKFHKENINYSLVSMTFIVKQLPDEIVVVTVVVDCVHKPAPPFTPLLLLVKEQYEVNLGGIHIYISEDKLSCILFGMASRQFLLLVWSCHSSYVFFLHRLSLSIVSSPISRMGSIPINFRVNN